MRKNSLKLFFGFLSVIILPTMVLAADTTGLISGAIWYSKTPLVEGETVKVYTAVWNARKEKLSGTIVFNDKDTILGTKDFIALPESVKDVSVDWVISAGEHAISARVTNTKIISSNGTTQPITLSETETPEQKDFVSKKIVVAPKSENVEESKSNSESTPIFAKAEAVISSTENLVANYTPEAVKTATQNVESWRGDTADILALKRDAFKAQINPTLSKEPESNISQTEPSVKTETKTPLTDTKNENTNQVKESSETIGKASPLAYVGLFFATLGAFVFSYGIIFYGLAILLLFFIIRFLYRKIFG